jgi:hypothetical protein
MRTLLRRLSQYSALMVALALPISSAPAQEKAQQPAERKVGILTQPFPGKGVVTLHSATLKIYNSLFNQFAERIEPIRFSGSYDYTVCTATNPFSGGCIYSVDVCNSNWQAEVSQLNFNITPAAIHITGIVNASWCGVNFNAPLETTANTSYSGSQHAILVTLSPTDIQLRFQVFGYDVPLPVHINVSPQLSLPPIPITAASFYFETARGPQTVHLIPSQTAVAMRDGYIEVQSYVTLW